LRASVAPAAARGSTNQGLLKRRYHSYSFSKKFTTHPPSPTPELW